MISAFFIRRPVFATVLSVVITLAGLIAMRALPIAQYPDIIPPEVVVSATYPGASAELVADTVAAPLEQRINGVGGMLYMTSSSSASGAMSITVTFEVGTDPDQATIDVNNRVQAALSRLPEEVRRQGVTVDKRSSAILLVITMFSPDKRYDPVFVSNHALLNVIDELKRTDGVGDASLFGAKDYSMRIWLRPDMLSRYGMTPADVAAAVREQNAQFAAGAFGEEPMVNPPDFTYGVTTPGRLLTPEEFGDIILRTDGDGAALRLKDVARIELGAQDYSFAATYNGAPAVAIGVYLQPGANALATAGAVRDRMAEVARGFPEGIAHAVPFDTTKFVQVSIDEVVLTFMEALVLVVAVVFLFLQNWRATLIPLLAVPVSLIGTFAGMYLLGFSINLLTLFGMVLAIGIVVDDAIVVLENVERIMSEEGLPPKAAAFKAMEQVSGAVVAIVLTLCAVFVPVAFMGGLVGEMYRQFAITIAVSVIISGIVALTLTPALCALILRPVHGQPWLPFRLFNRGFERVTGAYLAGVRFFLRRAVMGFLVLAVVLGASWSLFQRVPGALAPEEDQGYIFMVPMLPPAASLARTNMVAAELNQRIGSHPAVENVVTFAGFDLLSMSGKSSAGVSFISLKDWSERRAPEMAAQVLAPTFMGVMADVKDAMVLGFNPPPISGMSTTGGFELYVQSRGGGDPASLMKATGDLIAAAAKRPELAGVSTTFNTNVPRYLVHVDRAKAKALGVPLTSLFETMQSSFGSLYVNDFTLFGRAYRVNLQAEASFRERPEDLRYVFTRSDTGDMIPLSSLVTVDRVVGPDLMERYNVFPAAKVMGAPAPGFSTGDALAAIKQVAASSLPKDFTIGFVGSAYQEEATQGTASQAFLFGIIMVFLILAAQYERWSLPLAVVTAVPFAVFGAVLAIWLRGLQNDVYFQIGLVTLIGLSAKNAILIVEFAAARWRDGVPVADAAMEAAKLRFRPIIMTSLAFILGCLPLAISSGAGAGSRHSIGTGVIGGMLAATVLAPFLVPLFFRLVTRKDKPASGQPTDG